MCEREYVSYLDIKQANVHEIQICKPVDVGQRSGLHASVRLSDFFWNTYVGGGLVDKAVSCGS